MKHQKEKRARKGGANAEASPKHTFTGPAVAFDFGTSFLLVSLWNNDKVCILTNEDGFRTTPSYISFTEKDVLIGENARAQLFRNPHNTIYDIKKLLGKTYAELESTLPNYQFQIKPIKSSTAGAEMPGIVITSQGEEKVYKVTEMASLLFKRLKTIAENSCGVPVTKAVITIPASFNDFQREAMIEAVRLAGVEPIKLIHEASAAALSYGYDTTLKSPKPGEMDEKRILVFHLGGGSYDLTLMKSVEGKLIIVGQYHDPNLRGKNFDDRILNLCVNDFKKKTGIDVTKNTKAIKKLELICESAKVVLSSSASVPIEVDSLAEGMDYSTKIFRAKYEELCSDLFKTTIPPIEKLLTMHGYYKKDIDEIIIEGGLGKTPKVTEMLKECFGGKEPNNTVDPDEIIAIGGAIQAAFLAKAPSPYLLEAASVDVTPLSLTIEAAGGISKVLIPRNTLIPVKKSFLLDVTKNTHNFLGGKKTFMCLINLYEGEALLARHNRQICAIAIEYDPKEIDTIGTPQKSFPVELQIDISDSDTIKVTLTDKQFNKKKEIVIRGSTEPLASEEIDKMTKAAYAHIPNEMQIIAQIEHLKKLEEYCDNVILVAEKAQISTAVKEAFLNTKVQPILIWISQCLDSLNDLCNDYSLECSKKKKEIEEELMITLKNHI